tara:strand:+ start:459 stop:707 length:249 start_codon:yes stop_codon:yes gene_type:complete
MSANSILGFFGAIVLTGLIYIIIDPIIQGIIDGARCVAVECSTGLGYFQTFWDYFLVVALLLFAAYFVLQSIYESQPGAGGY